MTAVLHHFYNVCQGTRVALGEGFDDGKVDGEVGNTGDVVVLVVADDVYFLLIHLPGHEGVAERLAEIGQEARVDVFGRINPQPVNRVG